MPSPSTLRIATLDVFTDTRFTGNQLGVVHDPADAPLSQELKQTIAKEFGYAETVFIHDGKGAAAEEDEGVRVDIFTPDAELPFAGHPTIGTICYLAQQKQSPSDGPIPIRLSLKAGPVHATYHPSTRTASAQVPHNTHTHSRQLPSATVLRAQTGLAAFIKANPGIGAPLKEAFDVVSIVKGMSFVMAEMPSLGCLGAVKPTRAEEVFECDEGWETVVLGEMFFCREGEGLGVGSDGVLRARTRMLEPTIGEDAATGSASCALGVYLALEKGSAGGSYAFEFEQGVEMGRRSLIGVKVVLDGSGKKVEEVVLSGSAVVVLRGEMQL